MTRRDTLCLITLGLLVPFITPSAPAADDSLAPNIAAQLQSEAPFVRGMAWWAIAEKVGQDNNTQVIRWPKADPPQWFETWRNLPADRVLQADYVRQAVVLGIHDDGKKLLASVTKIRQRAERLAERIQAADASTQTAALLTRQLSQLQDIERTLNLQVEKSLGDLAPCQQLWLDARLAARPIALADPAVNFDRLLFVTRYGPHTKRNITRPFPWKHKPGGDINILTGLRPDGHIRPLIDGRLGPGHIRGVDLWFDADRLVFAFTQQPNWPPRVNSFDANQTMTLRKSQPPTHLFEMNLSTGEITQRTRHPHWFDIEPTYCPDGRIVFVSDRVGRAPQCGSFENDMTTTNLFALLQDGTVKHLTDNKDYDRYPHTLDNGLVAYTHWEYQERHFMEVHAIWTVRPDGTMADTLFKHHMPAPLALRDTRSIPGSDKLVSVATGHHTFAYGPVVVIDPSHGTNAASGISIVTPGVKPQEGGMAGNVVDGGGVVDRGGLYQTPWALSETCFLVAYAYPRANCTADCGTDSNAWGIYLIDTLGHKELIYRDGVLSAIAPIPLKQRPRPPLVVHPPLAGEMPKADNAAICYVADVYQGMPEIERGTVRYLRIAQHVAWPFDADKGKMPYLPGAAYAQQFGFWSWSPVRVIGTVPVAQDGSAHFTIPANTAVYFQALDENHMEVRRMRSMVSFAPGEVRGCTGCHESRAVSPQTDWPTRQAVLGPPETPQPPSWGAERRLGYEWLVQPVLDRHCVRCHGSDDPDGGLDLTAARESDGLMRSYHTLFGNRPGVEKPARPLVSVADRFSNSAVTRPMQFGSHRSPLARILLDDPLHQRQAKLPADDWQALVTWIDANAPYHDKFFDKRPEDGSPPARTVGQAF